MRYKATHTTRYRYDATVSQCQSEVRLTPRALPWQALIESRVERQGELPTQPPQTNLIRRPEQGNERESVRCAGPPRTPPWGKHHYF